MKMPLFLLFVIFLFNINHINAEVVEKTDDIDFDRLLQTKNSGNNIIESNKTSKNDQETAKNVTQNTEMPKTGLGIIGESMKKSLQEGFERDQKIEQNGEFKQYSCTYNCYVRFFAPPSSDLTVFVAAKNRIDAKTVVREMENKLCPNSVVYDVSECNRHE